MPQVAGMFMVSKMSTFFVSEVEKFWCVTVFHLASKIGTLRLPTIEKHLLVLQHLNGEIWPQTDFPIVYVMEVCHFSCCRRRKTIAANDSLVCSAFNMILISRKLSTWSATRACDFFAECRLLGNIEHIYKKKTIEICRSTNHESFRRSRHLPQFVTLVYRRSGSSIENANALLRCVPILPILLSKNAVAENGLTSSRENSPFRTRLTDAIYGFIPRWLGMCGVAGSRSYCRCYRESDINSRYIDNINYDWLAPQRASGRMPKRLVTVW